MKPVTSIVTRGSISRIRTLGAVLLLLAFSMTFAITANAQTSGNAGPIISYQGMISSPDGKPLSSPEAQITTTIYADENGMQPIWTDTYQAPVTNGVFSLALGSKTPLPSAQALDKPLWLGVGINGGAEMRPLTRLSTVPMAMNVADNAITSNKLASQSVTADKLGVDYVSAIAINGQRETLKDRTLNIRSAGETPVYFDEETSTLMIGNTQQVPGNFVGSQSGTAGTNSDDGNLPGANNPNSTNAVVGGTNNEAWDKKAFAVPELNGHNFVGGGDQNKAWGNFDAIGGGDMNVIDSMADTSFIGGGQHNLIQGNFDAIGGGEVNRIDSVPFGFIGGGDSNHILVAEGVIGGGHGNVVDGGLPTIGGAVLGGFYNTTQGSYASISGGDSNLITGRGPRSFIGGGHKNTATGWGHNGIVAGDSNYTYGLSSVVGAGFKNKSLGNRSGIVAGLYNQIDSTAPNSVIAGGVTDTIKSDESFIGAGDHNRAIGFGAAVVTGGTSGEGTTGNTAIGEMSIIGGGQSNSTYGTSSFIGGGALDSVAGAGAAIVAGEYNLIQNGSFASIIGSGYSNEIDSISWYSMIGSGLTNHIFAADWRSSNSVFVGAGDSNEVHASQGAAVVAGGRNTIKNGSSRSMIGTGYRNTIDSVTLYSMIGSGIGNHIFSANDNATSSFIAAGDSNEVHSFASFVGSGAHNFIDTKYGWSFIGGGYLNSMNVGMDSAMTANVIVGGTGNFLTNTLSSFIGGGDGNFITDGSARSQWCSILGGSGNSIQIGDLNTICGGGGNNVQQGFGSGAGPSNCFIGGGTSNSIKTFGIDPTTDVTIGGGNFNSVQASTGGVIGGGNGNRVFGSSNTIAGGTLNFEGRNYSFEHGIITDWTHGISIGGGENNTAFPTYATIAGGDSNSVWFRCDGSIIGGGQRNNIGDVGVFPIEDEPDPQGLLYGTIGGGRYGWIRPEAQYSSILGGYQNLVLDTATYGAIGGGKFNTIDTSVNFGSIGGGRQNHLMPFTSSNAAIPGGDSLIANSYAQTVVGYNNVMSSTFTKGTTHTFVAGGPQDLPLFMVGNGDKASTRSNAFEVSYDGHSTVFDVNGRTDGGGRIPFFGGSYQDNVISAWGDINPDGTVENGFGVLSATRASLGTYIVTLRLTDPSTGSFVNFKHGSITCTIRENDTTGLNGIISLDTTGDTTFMFDPTACGKITATEIGIFNVANTFVVHTYDGGCTLGNHPFFFKVCARQRED